MEEASIHIRDSSCIVDRIIKTQSCVGISDVVIT